MTLTSALKGLFAKNYRCVTATEAARAIDHGAVLVDVRERGEWDDGHAPTAVHIPLGDLQSRAGELPGDRPLITVCRSGMRSSKAAAQLAAAGRGVANLTGGMAAWSAAGLPVVRPGQGPARNAGPRR